MKIVVLLILFTVLNSQNIDAATNAFNPDIGANFLFLNTSSTRDTSEDGMKVQEVELNFRADIDPYTRGEILIALEPTETDPNDYEVAPEEVFVETTTIPLLTLRAGKYKGSLGKFNNTHTHAQPFINLPLQNEVLLGEEGVNEAGTSLSFLLPLSWFSELEYSYLNGDNEDIFDPDNKKSKTNLARFKNLFELSDSKTLEFGLSFANGKNTEGEMTEIFGGDITFKWRPTFWGKYHSFEFLTEFLEVDKKSDLIGGKMAGITSHLKYQLSERTWLQYRYDYLGLNKDRVENSILRHTALISFTPSEFSAVRLQFEDIREERELAESRVSLQLSFSLGAHPAHSY